MTAFCAAQKNFKHMKIQYFLIIGIITLISAQWGYAQKNKLRIEYIGIGQTQIWDIGSACRVSLNQGEEWVKEISKATGIPVNITRIDEENYTVENVKSLLQNLEFKNPDNTIVIFYGTGHGFNYSEDVMKYPIFAVHPDRKQLKKSEFEAYGLSLQKDVHDVLLGKGARFVMSIGELCNGIEEVNVPARFRPMSGCNENYLELFEEVRGDIIVASSRRGQLSYTSGLTGGVFWGEFLRAFDQSVDNCQQKADWGTILRTAQDNTIAANGQEPIYDVGYIGSPVEMITETAPKQKKAKRQRLQFPKKERFEGGEIKAPRIIYNKEH